MLNPSAERELTESYRISTEKARQWWNNQAFESRKNIVIESEAVINDDELVEDQIVSDIADSDYDKLPDETKQEIDVQIDEEEDIEEIFEVQGEEYLQCSKCDDLFTSNEDYDIHKSVDHGEEPEDSEESEETYQLAMNPDLTREALREANNLLTETEEKQLYGGYDKNGDIQSSVMPYNVPAKATGKYDNNPNEFFYSNKIFRDGSSTERNSALGESTDRFEADIENDQVVQKLPDDKRSFDVEAKLPRQMDFKTGGYAGKNIWGGDATLCEICGARFNTYPEFLNHYQTHDEANGPEFYESKASEGRSLEQVWNQSSPSQREGIMIEGGIEYEETGQSYFGDDGNDSDSLLHNLDDSGTDSGRWSAQNKSAMDSLSNTSYNNLPTNIRDRVDSGIISYGLNLEGESKANEGLVYAKIFKMSNDGMFGGEIQLVAEGKNKELTEEESLRIKDQYNMKTESGGYSGYVDESEFGIGESKATEKGEWDWLDKSSDNEEVEYKNDGISDISVPNVEPKGVDANEFLDNLDIGVEAVDYVYPTKANESTKSYITESEPFDEEYEEFEDSDDKIIEETITLRKLTGYSDNSIAQELHINYGVSHEEALEKVYSVEVSTNDKVSQTFFGKMYKECTESEKDELRMYSGSD